MTLRYALFLWASQRYEWYMLELYPDYPSACRYLDMCVQSGIPREHILIRSVDIPEYPDTPPPDIDG